MNLLVVGSGAREHTIVWKLSQSTQVDALFMGKQAVDDDCFQVGPMVGALLDWPQAMNVIALELGQDKVRATREVEGGAQEMLELSWPFVTPVPSMRGLHLHTLQKYFATSKSLQGLQDTKFLMWGQTILQPAVFSHPNSQGMDLSGDPAAHGK